MPNFLADYRAKRAAVPTPEPMGAEARDGPVRGGIFVVQKHAASRLHWDLRLEWGGVLKSWAVPKGPSADPAQKRFAAPTEDHPLEYAGFEGVIPAGAYGAGPMILWDRGRWEPVGDAVAGLAGGKVLFELFGAKLRGRWTLVRTRPRDRAPEWLLIKETGDAHVRRGPDAWDDRSVLTGATLDDLRGAPARLAALAEEASRLGAPRRPVLVATTEPMLAEPADEAFDGEEWLHELKIDGFRALVGREGARAAIHYRRGADATAAFPDLCAALSALVARDFVADGEIAVLDEAGRPVFQRLQKRALLTAPRDLARAAVELPATLFLFDLLAFDGLDLRPLPLAARKRLLGQLIPGGGRLQVLEPVAGRGRALFASVRELGLEGIVSKRADSAYRAGRSRDWIKVRLERAADFAVVGFSAGRGRRDAVGALHLAARAPEGLRYVGRVGTGLDERELERARAALLAQPLPGAPCTGPVPKGVGHRWSEPRLVVEVRYKEITAEGLLRQPSFLRFRDDKTPEDCPLPGEAAVPEAPAAPEAPASPRPSGARPARELKLTNLDKPFWPEDGFTKGDLIDYYRAIAPWLLPWLRDRPLTLTRFPDGIHGKSFFQKDAPDFVPSWIRTVRVPGEGERPLDFVVCDDLDTLLWVANLGTIPLHIGAGRAPAFARADWCSIDLDPKEAPFAHVVQLARAARELCDELELPAYAKTSGQKGLHVLIPLGGKLSHAEAKSLGELLARVLESRHPQIASTARHIPSRRGRVYLDYLQNGEGKTLAAPFCARPVPGATVSMPLRWSEVDARLDPRRFTLKTAPSRLRKLGEDPAANVLREAPDLPAALARLAKLLA